jgi:hypothetical protein
MVMDLTAFDAAIKENYSEGALYDVISARAPLLALIPKVTNFVGDPWVVPVQYANPQSVGSGYGNFSTIAANVGNSKQTRFLVTSTQHYGVISVQRELMLASADPAGAFADAFDNEVRSVLKALGTDIHRQLWGTSANILGQCATDATDAGGPITLTKKRDAKKFFVGMRIIASANADGSSPRSGVGTVSAVDWAAGTVTYTGTITGITTSDYIFREAGASSGISGLQDWMPASTPSSAAFFGVNRSVDPRLYGQYLDAAGMSVTEACIDATIKADDEGGKIDVIVMGPGSFAVLQEENQGDRRYPAAEMIAKLGFDTISLANGATVVMDRYAPEGEAFALTLDSWKLLSRGDLVHFVDEDGRILLRNTANDTFEARVASYCNLACHAPVQNVRIGNLKFKVI